jgi:hypothetical protein
MKLHKIPSLSNTLLSKHEVHRYLRWLVHSTLSYHLDDGGEDGSGLRNILWTDKIEEAVLDRLVLNHACLVEYAPTPERWNKLWDVWDTYMTELDKARALFGPLVNRFTNLASNTRILMHEENTDDPKTIRDTLAGDDGFTDRHLLTPLINEDPCDADAALIDLARFGRRSLDGAVNEDDFIMALYECFENALSGPLSTSEDDWVWGEDGEAWTEERGHADELIFAAISEHTLGGGIVEWHRGKEDGNDGDLSGSPFFIPTPDHLSGIVTTATLKLAARFLESSKDALRLYASRRVSDMLLEAQTAYMADLRLKRDAHKELSAEMEERLKDTESRFDALSGSLATVPRWTECGLDSNWSVRAWHYGTSSPNRQSGDCYVIEDDCTAVGDPAFVIVQRTWDEDGEDTVKHLSRFHTLDKARRFLEEMVRVDPKLNTQRA